MNEMKMAIVKSLGQYGFEESFRSINLAPPSVRNEAIAFLATASITADFLKKFRVITEEELRSR